MSNEWKYVLEFWFGRAGDNFLQNKSLWFKKDSNFDRVIAETFQKLLVEITRGHHEEWKETSEPCLAYIIVLDQFSRNIFRDLPQSFAQDEQALSTSLNGIERGTDEPLHAVQKTFFYMPLMHSEDLEVQKKSCELFLKLAESAPENYEASLRSNYDYAKLHYEIIEKFGRFPHRNKILGRESTAEEEAFLTKPGSSF